MGKKINECPNYNSTEPEKFMPYKKGQGRAWKVLIASWKGQFAPKRQKGNPFLPPWTPLVVSVKADLCAPASL